MSGYQTVVVFGLKMPYVLVRESFLTGSCCVEGLPLNEGKLLGRNEYICLS